MTQKVSILVLGLQCEKHPVECRRSWKEAQDAEQMQPKVRLEDHRFYMQIKSVAIPAFESNAITFTQLFQFIGWYRDASHAKMQVPANPAHMKTQLQLRPAKGYAKHAAKTRAKLYNMVTTEYLRPSHNVCLRFKSIRCRFVFQKSTETRSSS